MNTSHKDLHTKWTLGGLLISLGIIYGDIGTSPLYVMKAILGDHIISAILFWEEFQLYFGHLLYNNHQIIQLLLIIMVKVEFRFVCIS
jgi:hypothetical protein